MTDLRFPTGWTELDHLIGDLGPKRFVVVAGIPSAGMTATLLSIVNQAALVQRVPTMLVDLENGIDILTNRLLACAASVDYNKIRDGGLDPHDNARMNSALDRMSTASLWMTDLRGARTITGLHAELERLPRRPGLIAIDGTRYLTAPDDYTTDGMSALARDLKNLSSIARCAVVVTHPLRHTTSSERRPMLEHFGEMGEDFPNHADQVLILHRPGQHNEHGEPGVLEMRVAKNRQGPTGSVDFAALLHRSRVVPFDPPAAVA